MLIKFQYSYVKPFWIWVLLILPYLTSFGVAHPVPDVPLRAFFKADKSVVIKIEIDPRCFSEDPETEPYLRLDQYLQLSQPVLDALRSKAQKFVEQTVEISFFPGLVDPPDWKFDFTTFNSKKLGRSDDPVMVTGSWNLGQIVDQTGYQLRALPEGRLSIVFLNYYQEKSLPGLQVLFPGETSRILDLTGLSEATANDPSKELVKAIYSSEIWTTFISFLRDGFVHVVPLGADHILFVLGLFLMSRKLRVLIWQVSTFTVAHTITLGLATLGLVNVSGVLVEPIIAGSIIVIALENIFLPRYSPWRLLVVFIFGLIHGLGFAGALSRLDLPDTSLLVSLVGFNVGVEAGQLLVIGIAFGLTLWVRGSEQYRKFVVLPASVSIAVMGAYWMIQRIYFQ